MHVNLSGIEFGLQQFCVGLGLGGAGAAGGGAETVAQRVDAGSEISVQRLSPAVAASLCHSLHSFPAFR